MNEVIHVNATSLSAAVTALQQGNAAVIAGGTDILNELKSMNSPNAPATLVNIKTIPNLSYIKEEGGMLKIGALTKLADIAASTTVQTNYAALAQAAAKVSAPELRNMGTIGGNLCQHVRCWYYQGEYNAFSCLRKNPSGVCYGLLGDNRYHSIFGSASGCVAVNPSDIAPAVLAMGGKIVTTKSTYNASDFFAVNLAPKGEGTTVLASNEIVSEIQIPTPAAGTKSAFIKFALRNAIDFPVVNCAAVITQSAGTVSAVSIVLNAVYNLPRKATEAENSIKGQAITTATADAAGTAAVSAAAALPVSTGTGNKYKIQIAKTMVKRAILACQ